MTEVVSTIAAIRELLAPERHARRSVGLVPTMGSLHDGHVSLIERARADNEVVVVSVFVNPLQFSPDEDLDSYPRDLERDTAICSDNDVHAVFAPSVAEMYGSTPVTSVEVGGVALPLEGRSRPSHFAGVATVVAKLLSIVQPDRAYFGEKDYQQLAVVTAMTRDLSFPVEVVGCPIVREPDGLALSSRNVHLSPAERDQAPVLRKALDAGLAALDAGERCAEVVENVMRSVVAAAPLAGIDYVAAVDADTLDTAGQLSGEVRLLLAVRFGDTRLIDNAGWRPPG